MSTAETSYEARIAYRKYMRAVRLTDEGPDDCGPIEAARIASRVAEAARLAVVYADDVAGASGKRARKHALAALELSSVAAITAMHTLQRVAEKE